MKILVISQVFWPDTSSISQYLTDLAEELTRRNHQVHVLTSQRNYEDPIVQYIRKDLFHKIAIERIWQTGFDKSTKIGRLLNFFTFNIALFLRLLSLRRGRYRIIIGLTVPPFMSLFGIIAAKMKRSAFFYWAMDLQPELAIVSGYLRKQSITAKLLLLLSKYLFKQADVIFALDRYMANYIVGRGAKRERVLVNPLWPIMSEIDNGPIEKNPFRCEHKLNGKIVVMYSGNHAVVHPLDTLLKAALALKNDPRFVFVFIGSGVRKKDVTLMKTKNGLTNILQLPYLKRDQIHLSLGAADIHVVIQGNCCTGFTHPSKIYGAMFVGRPIAYIGPEPSHITDILTACPGNISIEHGNVEKLVADLLLFANKSDDQRLYIGLNNMQYAQKHFRRSQLIDNLIKEIEKFGYIDIIHTTSPPICADKTLKNDVAKMINDNDVS